MRCFFHPETEAVASCKHCFKAVCRSCGRNDPAGVSCSELCAEEVLEAYKLLVQFKMQAGIGKNRKRFSTMFIIFMSSGLGFYAIATMMTLRYKHIDFVGVTMGTLFIGLAIFSFLKERIANKSAAK